MIRFLIKGILRDKHRSLVPLIIVSVGVAMSVFMYTYIWGFIDDLTKTNAVYETGHLKVMTRAYKEISDQIPNDLALTNTDSLIHDMEKEYPGVDWTPRIKFAGLLDIPDEKGETRAQTTVFGIALDLLGKDSGERERFNLEKSIQEGHLPDKQGDILIPVTMAKSLDVTVGDTATLISSSALGGMAIHNFRIAGTVKFGVQALDRNTVIADIGDVRYALDMLSGSGEILGYFENELYQSEKAHEIKEEFNEKYSNPEEEFSPVMLTLEDQNNLGELLRISKLELYIIVGVFLFVISLILWNSGLMSGIRRYGEIGVRMAIGESKARVYKEMLIESVVIGFVGSVIGIAIGILGSYYLQEN
ncbi:MAG: FtsX-like permease family protein [Candidatus Aminicenantes bacterium]|nr:FtsX-like permease family protein [Candidatus Aminicenantes bacterium]